MSNNNNYQEIEPDVTTQKLSHSDELTIGLLHDCAKRGKYRGEQPSPSICKVSRTLRDLSESSFNPQLVSIGPIHREDPKLQEFEWQKECYLNDLLSLCEDSTSKETLLEACLLKVKTKIPEIRESYGGMIKKYSDVELARMMVMDGCFILEFCFKHAEEDLYLPNKMQNCRIAMDLMLLENQVPFVVLQALFDCLTPYTVEEKQSVTLSQVLNRHLAPYIKLFRPPLPEKNSTTDVHSDLPKKTSTTDVHSDLPKQNSPTDVDSDSTHDHILGYLHKRYRLVAAKSSKPKDAEASKLADEEQAAKSSNPIHADKDGTTVGPGGSRDSHGILWCCVPAPSQHAEASKPVDEELAAKSSNPTNAEEDEERIEDTAFHSIVELDRSGMNFKPHQEDEWSMTIKFQSFHFACLPGVWKPTLLMPTLVIDDTTELILRNFIAYEQSFPTDRYYFTSYAHAMDMLIDTQEDIAKLVKSKVLVNSLGSNQDAADMINTICRNMFVTGFHYTEVFKQMDEYYNRFWPKNIAKLRRIYFSNPWSAIALFVGIIVFLATVVSAIFAVLDYFR